MHLEEFAEGSSFFHRLDPRVKFIAVLPFIIVVAVSHGLRVPSMALILSLIMTIAASLPWDKLLSRMVVVNVFVIMLWVFIPFSYPGHAILHIGPIAATGEGLLYVASISLKTNAIVLATISVLGTSEVFALAHAAVHMRAPAKLVYLFFFFYRYISVMHEEYSRIRKAMTIRSFRAGTNMHTYRAIAYLAGMLLVNSYERSQRIYNAMLCRGFRGTFPVIDHFELKKSDILFGIFMLLITGVFIVMNWSVNHG